jgi:hypothetical protein
MAGLILPAGVAAFGSQERAFGCHKNAHQGSLVSSIASAEKCPPRRRICELDALIYRPPRHERRLGFYYFFWAFTPIHTRLTSATAIVLRPRATR